MVQGVKVRPVHSQPKVCVYSFAFTAFLHSLYIIFNFLARLSPTDIRVTPHNPGSPSADVMWSFAGEPTHLSCIRVVIQVEGKPPNLLNVVASKKQQ